MLIVTVYYHYSHTLGITEAEGIKAVDKPAITIPKRLVTVKNIVMSQSNLDRHKPKIDWFNGKINGIKGVSTELTEVTHQARLKYSRDDPIQQDDGLKSFLFARKYSHDYPIQQDDGLKPFLFDVAEHGLNYAYEKFELANPNCDQFKKTKTKKPRDVIIIGAGMSGLVAGYELTQVGHRVQILELQHRVGGRVKTISDEIFFPGLWSDGKSVIYTCNSSVARSYIEYVYL